MTVDASHTNVTGLPLHTRFNAISSLVFLKFSSLY